MLTYFILLQNFQGNEAMFEAVEQQDMDAVQILHNIQYTPEELDLNTPNRGRGGWHLWISPSWRTMYPLLGFFWRQGPEKVHTVSKLENKAYTSKARPQFYAAGVVVTGH